MEFPQEKIKTTHLYTDSSDIYFLIGFLTKGPRGWEHEFIRNFKQLMSKDCVKFALNTTQSTLVTLSKMKIDKTLEIV